jgi:hypothetical protein
MTTAPPAAALLAVPFRAPMPWTYHDGGRAAAGYRGQAGDCVCRAIAIAAGLGYQEVYGRLNELGRAERITKRNKTRSTARNGVGKRAVRKMITGDFGWRWTPTMGIGTGTTVHLAAGELPGGTLIVQASRHVTAVIDGTVYDTHDPGRDGTRCVYGFWQPPGAEPWTWVSPR